METKISVGEGMTQDMANAIELSALFRALVKKGIITKEEVEKEVPAVIKDLKQALMLIKAKK